MLALLAHVGSAGTAHADASVTVELRGEKGAPVDGTVAMVKGEMRLTCTTKEGRCELRSVPGGMYTVEVRVPGRPAPKPKHVMIPPAGQAKLVVNAG